VRRCIKEKLAGSGPGARTGKLMRICKDAGKNRPGLILARYCGDRNKPGDEEFMPRPCGATELVFIPGTRRGTLKRDKLCEP
jgi:hypothetical protein